MTTQPGGSAQFGIGEWLMQRVTAIYLSGFMLWLAVRLGVQLPADYLAWKVWFAPVSVRLAFGLAFLSLIIHAWVGMRSVFLDYFKPLWLRLVAHLLLVLLLITQAFWAVQLLFIEATR